MKRWSCLLLDANVILELFRAGIWDRFVEACDLYVSETVLGEAQFWEDDARVRHDIDLSADVAAGRVTKFSVPLAEVTAFIQSFDALYMERLDPGEAESLAFLVKTSEEHFICSADAIVFRVLGNLDRSVQGVSLQEVLAKCGLGRKLAQQFSKAFREKWTRVGVEERIRGGGQKR